MTAFEQYQKVANHIDIMWTATPVFMIGEVINIDAPYIVLDIYGLGVNETYSCLQNIQGNKISCFGLNRGLAHKLASDAQEAFNNAFVDGLLFERVRIEEPVTRYEDNLYLGVVKFTTRG